MRNFRKNRKLAICIIIGLVVILAILTTLLSRTQSEYDFEVHFIDVGQADAALVICEGQTMLIDGGNVDDSGLIYTYLKDRKINHLNYIIATHAHEDHVGGLAGALNYATVDKVYCPVTSYDSKVFENFVKYVERRNTEIIVPTVKDTFSLGSAEVQIVGVNASSDTNDTSIILRITYGKTSFLFTGDAERAAENAVINSGQNIESTVLKVGHHGSDTSTSYLFLREIMPEYAVISVGRDNEYEHPTEEVLSRLRDANVKVYRTDLQGTIVCTSNGKDVKFEVYKNSGADTLKEVGGARDTTAHETIPDHIDLPDNETQLTEPVETVIDETNDELPTFIININSNVFHVPSCRHAQNIKAENRQEFFGTRDEAIELGYKSCGTCKP